MNSLKPNKLCLASLPDIAVAAVPSICRSDFQAHPSSIDFGCVSMTAHLPPFLDHTLLGVVSHVEPKTTAGITSLVTRATNVGMLAPSLKQIAVEKHVVLNSFRDEYFK